MKRKERTNGERNPRGRLRGVERGVWEAKGSKKQEVSESGIKIEWGGGYA